MVELERKRSAGDVLRLALRLYARYPILFASITVCVIAPYDLARLAVVGIGPLGSGKQATGEAYLFELMYFSLASPLISALHMRAVLDIGSGGRPRIGSVAARGLRVLPVVAAAEIVAGLTIAVGYLMLIVPGVLFTLWWAVAAQTAAVEHEGWIPALRRSRQLTAGNYMHLIGVLLTAAIGTGAVDLLVRIVFHAAGSGPLFAGRGTGAGWVALGIASHTITASFLALTYAALYFDLRARKSEPSLVRPGHEAVS